MTLSTPRFQAGAGLGAPQDGQAPFLNRRNLGRAVAIAIALAALSPLLFTGAASFGS